jgi:hypothetical protein
MLTHTLLEALTSFGREEGGGSVLFQGLRAMRSQGPRLSHVEEMFNGKPAKSLISVAHIKARNATSLISETPPRREDEGKPTYFGCPDGYCAYQAPFLDSRTTAVITPWMDSVETRDGLVDHIAA